MSIHFLLIDPQNDFAHSKGQLFVPHADKDMQRLAELLTQLQANIDAIHISLDSHHLLDISHPLFWQDAQGHAPAPFTTISRKAVDCGTWAVRRNSDKNKAIDYVTFLEKNARYQLTIWPPHCLLGTWGHNVVDSVALSIRAWEQQGQIANYMFKGLNIWTEHYSIVQADVIDENDSHTQVNENLLQQLNQASTIFVAGEALSHCVANSVYDLVQQCPELLKKLVLIEDCCSPVTGFENLGRQFIQDLSSKGLRLMDCATVQQRYC